MGNVDMIRVYMNNGEPQVDDLWSTSTVRPQLDTAIQGNSDLSIVNGSRTGNNTKISVLRKLNTGDPKDFAITLNNIDIVYAGNTNNDNFLQHTFRGKTQIKFQKT